MFTERWQPRTNSGVYRCAKFGQNRYSSFDNIKLSTFCPFGLKTPIHAPEIWVWRIFYPFPKWGAISTKPPKGTSAGRNCSSGVLIMSLSAIVPEKSPGNKKCDEEEEEEEEKRHIFGLFGIAVKWL